MTIHVMDASALNAFLRGEPGKEVVANVLALPDNQNIAHAVNLCEVYYDTLRIAGRATAEQAIANVYAAQVRSREDLDPAFWELVGQLKVNPGKISLADGFGLALAMREGATLVTADHHEFDRIAPLNLCPILFIR